ncbi:hypothetical protein D9Q98_007450 [Chlorella vulgaris]|uniref:WH2 domain-containing protein n=1 Tax=Chlorella vulgaris TaxID=3077 RepID=A0A9D4TLC7_CHLVU|nr:hypothetical protein D9Q98_007450 [Chlorella vulgaris]
MVCAVLTRAAGQSAEPPLPLRRVVAHKPNPSWFAPIVGFGGPPSLLWQEQQQQEEAARQSQQEEREQQAQAQQEHHTQRPGLKGQQQPPAAPVSPGAELQPPRAGQPSSQPLAYDVGKLQQSLPHSAASHRQPQQRSPPWYSQGWQQQQQAPLSERPQSRPQPDAASSKPDVELQTYSGGNPFSEAVPLGSAADAPAAPAATAAPAAQPGSAVAPQLPPPVVGCLEAAAPRGSTRRKLPPPPRFLVVRSGQVGQQALAAACESGAASGGAACPLAAAGAASRPPVAHAGRTSMQALEPADIIAAAGRLRCTAAPSPEVAGASSPDYAPPVELLAAIQQGAFKLRSVVEREQDTADTAGPALGGPSAGMAGLLRRVAERT